MNYIKHLTGFFDKVILDNSLNPTHISLYIALFQCWNCNRFRNPISINRDEIMRISKISSKVTYHKCLKNLHALGYINYEPSFNPFRGSHVILFNFSEPQTISPKTEASISNFKHVIETAPEQVLPENLYKFETGTAQVVVPSINNRNNTNISKSINEHSLEKKEIFEIIPPKLEDVKTYFSSLETDENEAERFFNHFQSNGWLVGGKSKMKNWQAAAKNWIMNLQRFIPVQVAAATPIPGNLKTSNKKKYDEPL